MVRALGLAAAQGARGAALDAVQPFKAGDGKSDDKDAKPVCWIGPKHVGCCVVEIHGPLQLFFFLLAFACVIMLIVHLIWREIRAVPIILGLIAILVSIYLIWLGKAIYILKAFRKEVDRFRALNDKLKVNVDKLESQNTEYESQNKEHQKANESLNEKIQDLAHVEKQLGLLATECSGSVKEARGLIERLERNIKLDTVNTVFQFFDRADRDKNGKVDGNEVSLFVDNLGFLWKHLPQFDPTSMKTSIKENGGLSLEQVHKLVEIMMLEQGTAEPATIAAKLEKIFKKETLDEEPDLEANDSTTLPGNPCA